MRSLLLRGGALGDFLVTLPLLEALSLRFPGGHVELIGNPRAAGLAVTAGLLTAAHDQNEARWAALFSGEPLPGSLAEWLGSFDLIASFWPDPDGTLENALRSAAKGRVIGASAHPATGPAAQHFLTALAELTLPAVPLVTRLRRFEGARHGVAIHPGSGSPRKNWPRDRWDCVSGALSGEETVHTIVGPAERDAALAGSTHLWSNLPLAVVANRLATCRLYLGNDSGISHLAAACGVPSVLLFGPSEASMWAPPSPDVTVLSDAPLVLPEHVLDVARTRLRQGG